ncbi:uncharacterized protein Dmul_22580 [Desulfococcus multivorans]|nr:uncharacterized protein Dmul_22580 [Desulfococcus multivorans]
MGENGSPKLVGAHDESLRVAQIRTFRKLGWELSIIMSNYAAKIGFFRNK